LNKDKFIINSIATEECERLRESFNMVNLFQIFEDKIKNKMDEILK
jgi:hypothetical protein